MPGAFLRAERRRDAEYGARSGHRNALAFHAVTVQPDAAKGVLSPEYFASSAIGEEAKKRDLRVGLSMMPGIQRFAVD